MKMTTNDVKLLTMRQFLFLNWLYHRKMHKVFCNVENIDIDCFNCLQKNHDCAKGVIPASYFYKKINRQYFDCKRVLDSLKEEKYVMEMNLQAKDFHVFYQITEDGARFYEEFEDFYSISCRNNSGKK